MAKSSEISNKIKKDKAKERDIVMKFFNCKRPKMKGRKTDDLDIFEYFYGFYSFRAYQNSLKKLEDRKSPFKKLKTVKEYDSGPKIQISKSNFLDMSAKNLEGLKNSDLKSVNEKKENYSIYSIHYFIIISFSRQEI